MVSIKRQTSLCQPGLIVVSIEIHTTMVVSDLMHGVDQKG